MVLANGLQTAYEVKSMPFDLLKLGVSVILSQDIKTNRKETGSK